MKNYHPVAVAPEHLVDAAHRHVFAPLVFRHWHKHNAVNLGLPAADDHDDPVVSAPAPRPVAARDRGPIPVNAAADTAVVNGLRGLQDWHRSMLKSGRIRDRNEDEQSVGAGQS